MKLRDLFQDAGTGQLSGTKMWSFVANAIASWAVIYMILKQALDFGWVIAYLACVGGSAVASKFVSLKYGSVVAAPSPVATTPAPEAQP